MSRSRYPIPGYGNKMIKIGKALSSDPLVVAGGAILIVIFTSAIFADFVAPYAVDTEFRDHFFHPPSRIHFRNEKGEFVHPYVLKTYLVDPRKHIFDEGSPIWIGRIITERNTNPYIPERIEEDFPFAILRDERGVEFAQVLTAIENGDNTGVFVG